MSLDLIHLEGGEDAVRKYGVPFPKETFEAMAQTEAVLFGAAGLSPVVRGFRSGFDLYANVHPIKALPGICANQPKADFVIMRENMEGLYGRVGYVDGDHYVNLRIFTKKGMKRIIRFSFGLAVKEGGKKVTMTHKAHVLTYTDEP
jgi:isocitrate/isopropylmalate dehydrogenase